MTELIKELMPQHVAIIMDGNGRWAKSRGVPRVAGHRAGMEAMKKIVDHSDKLGIKYLTVYAFSTENWKRSMEEVSGIFGLLVAFVKRDLKELIENNVRVEVLGDYSSIPEDARRSLQKTLDDTKADTGLQFNIALNYGARDEIRRSVEDIAAKVKAGQLEPEDVTEELIAEGLWTGKSHSYTPDPELIIRTSGGGRAAVQLPALAGGLQRVRVHRRAVAGLHAGGVREVHRRVPVERQTLRRKVNRDREDFAL